MSGWSGQPGGPRYCHRKPCQRQGKRLGHIAKRKRKQVDVDEAVQEEEDNDKLPAGLDLAELEEICEMRFISPKKLARVPQRWNAVPDEKKELELLVYGKYTLGDEDINGSYAWHWLTKSAILEMGFDETDLDEAVEAHIADLQRLYRGE